NMCVNATHAMAENGGRIAISTRNVHISEEQASLMAGAAAGPHVRIAVEDNGHGMSKEIMEKIFEPFFTTKDPGKGTGLGLATSYGIVRQHGGWISCESEEGVGTTFSIFLPRIEKPAAAECEEPVRDTHSGDGNETVLIVDDEAVVLAVAEGALAHHGYQSVGACDGEQALEIYRARSDEIAVVVLDLTMPRLSGRDTFVKLQQEEHPPPVIICSGYLVDLDEFEEETGARPVGFVQKPFSLDDLAQTVRDAIDGAELTAVS
ncbi:MAG: ATP-binding protein, partial [Verrucomicrobiales bacterium]